MPVIVVGADTPIGEAIVEGLSGRNGEVRAFVSDPAAADRLKALGVKVATGDVSDASHVEGACINVHTAVLLSAAGYDDRERSFAEDPASVLEGWIEAVGSAGVARVVWIDEGDPPRTAAAEEAVVDAGLERQAIVRQVVELDEADSIPSR